MEISKKSWHYRLIKKVLDYNDKKFEGLSLCPYFWLMVFSLALSVLAAIGFIAICCIVILSLQHCWWQTLYIVAGLAISGLFFYYLSKFIDLEKIFAGCIILLFVIFFAGSIFTDGIVKTLIIFAIVIVSALVFLVVAVLLIAISCLIIFLIGKIINSRNETVKLTLAYIKAIKEKICPLLIFKN